MSKIIKFRPQISVYLHALLLAIAKNINCMASIGSFNRISTMIELGVNLCHHRLPMLKHLPRLRHHLAAGT